MKLGPSTTHPDSYIDIQPHPGYEFAKNISRSHLRTKQGNLYSYTDPSCLQIEVKFKTSWVTSSDRSLVNSWWENISLLRFFETSSYQIADGTYLADGSILADGGDVRMIHGKLIDVSEPFQKFINPYSQIFYDGQIILSTA